MKTERLFALFSLFSLLLLLFILLPLGRLFLVQNPAYLVELMGEASVRQALFLSVWAAFLTGLVACTLGTPLAYVLARKEFKGKSLVEAIVDIPLAVPHTVAGIALLFIYGRRGLLGGIADFYGSLLGVIVAMLFVSAPFAVNSIREGFEAVDERLEQAAMSLGASRFEAFRRVSLPLAKRSILTGGILTWARSISEFGAVIVLAYYARFWSPLTMQTESAMTAPALVYDQFLQFGLERSSGIAVLLLTICILMFTVMRYFAYGGRE